MAINRFMQPWKREIKGAYYTPNFEAWANLLEKKDTDMEETLAGADKLDTLIPEAGLRLRDDRANYLAEINKKREALVNSLYESGNTSEARRQIRGLSSEILGSDRISKYKIDKEMMPAALKIVNSQTKDTDVYGIPGDEWYDPKTGAFRQLTADQYDPASAYAYTKTEDTHKMFHDAGAGIQSMFSQFKTIGEEVSAIKYFDENTGQEKTKYVFKGSQGTKEFIDAEHLIKYLDADRGVYGKYAEELYNNLQGDARAYWDAKYRGLPEAEKKRRFFEDLISANYDRIYSKSTEESFIQDAGVRGSSKGTDEDLIPRPSVVGSKVGGIGYQYENLESAGQIVNNADKLNTEIATFKQPQVDKANKILSSKFGDQKVITKGSDGRLRLSPELLQQATPEQLQAIYGEPLDTLGTTVNDFIAKSNDDLLALKQKKEVYDEILHEGGLDDLSTKRILKELYSKAEIIADEKARAAARPIAGDKEIQTEAGRKKAESTKATKENIEKEFQKLLEASEHKDLKELNDRINKRKSAIYEGEATAYMLLNHSAASEKVNNGLTEAVMQITRNSNLEIKVPGTDTYITGEQRDKVNEVLNNYFNAGSREEFFKKHSNSFQTFFDKEESRWKLLINVNNQAFSEAMGQKGIVNLEVPMSDSFIVSDGTKVTLPEALNLESDPDVISDLQKVETAYAEKGLYTAFLPGQNGEKYMIKENVISSDPESGNVTTTFKVKFDDGIADYRLEVSNAREGVALKKVIGLISQMPKDEQGAKEAATKLISAYSNQIPTVASMAPEQLEQQIDQWLGRGLGKLDPSSELYTIKGGNNVGYIDKKLQIGVETIAGHVWAETGATIQVNQVHDPDRENENSKHLTGEAFDVSWSSPEDRSKVLEGVKSMLADNVEFKPSKRYYTLASKFGRIKVLYETKETNPNATGEHLHFIKY